MSRARTALALSIVLAATLAATPARADGGGGDGGGVWLGWLVAGTGVVAGGALTAYGLTFDCSETSSDCQRRAAIAIWGGLGVAGLAGAVGIALVQLHVQPANAPPTAPAPRVSLVVTPSPGDVLVVRGRF